MVIATRVPFKPLNAFYCVFLSLALLSTEMGLIGIISSSLLIYKVNLDSKLLIDGSDICSLKGKSNGTLTVECEDSCGLLTCPGFSIDKLDKEGTGAELCGIVKECTRGRYSAGGLALIFSLLQTGWTIYYISVVFVYRESMTDMDFKDRWCCFIISNGLYLLFTLIPLTLALFFKLAHVPKNPNTKAKASGNLNINQNDDQFYCNGNSIGIFFVSWCGINVGFCLVAILLVLYFQRIRRNQQDALALYGVRKTGIDDDFDLAHPFDHNLVMIDVEDNKKESKCQTKVTPLPPTKNHTVDNDGFSRTSKKSKESAADSDGGKGFLDSSLDDRPSSKTGGMILGSKKPKMKHRIENSGSGSGSVEKGRHKRKIGTQKRSAVAVGDQKMSKKF